MLAFCCHNPIATAKMAQNDEYTNSKSFVPKNVGAVLKGFRCPKRFFSCSLSTALRCYTRYFSYVFIFDCLKAPFRRFTFECLKALRMIFYLFTFDCLKVPYTIFFMFIFGCLHSVFYMLVFDCLK